MLHWIINYLCGEEGDTLVKLLFAMSSLVYREAEGNFVSELSDSPPSHKGHLSNPVLVLNLNSQQCNRDP